jgi:hypothetical protein
MLPHQCSTPGAGLTTALGVIEFLAALKNIFMNGWYSIRN